MKPLFRKGQRFNTINEQIEVKQVYKAGQKYATENINFYLIYSSDMGEDVVSEYNLYALLKDNQIN